MIDRDDIHGTRLRRTLEIWAMLQAGRISTADDLARKFGCSRRTIFRDLDLLRRVGVDLQYETYLGGYSAARGTCASHFGLDPEELRMLLVAVAASPVAKLRSFDKVLQQAVAKLMALTTEAVRIETRNLLRCVSFFNDSTAVHEKQLEVFGHLLNALAKTECVRIKFHQVENAGQFTIFSLYRIFRSVRNWVVVGQSSFHCATIKLLLDDIESAELTGDHYKIPIHFHYASSEALQNPWIALSRTPSSQSPELSEAGV